MSVSYGVLGSIWEAIIGETALPGPYQEMEFPSWLLPQFGQMLANLVNLTNDHTIGYKLGLTENQINEYLANVWIYSMNKTPGDPYFEDNPIPSCPHDWQCAYQGVHVFGPGIQMLTLYQWNMCICMAYQTCLMRIYDLYDGWQPKTPNLEVWPYFYYMYNTTFGQLIIDDFVEREAPPPGLVAALKANYTEDIQRKYGFLNEPDMGSAIQFWQTANWLWDWKYFVNPGDAFQVMKDIVQMRPIALTSACNRVGNPFGPSKKGERRTIFSCQPFHETTM